ncbi:MAG: GNAT family N-acetyltransferase [Promethearchaeota archaeon]
MLKAKEDLLNDLYNIIIECSQCLKLKGINQWNPPYPKSLFLKDIKNGSIFYFKKDDEIVSTVTIYDRKPLYYPKDIWNDTYKCWYISRLAVSRKYKNKNYGRKILFEIETQAVEYGKERLRLDLIQSNPFLKKYYLNQGFKACYETEIFGQKVIFMEKHLKQDCL